MKDNTPGAQEFFSSSCFLTVDRMMEIDYYCRTRGFQPSRTLFFVTKGDTMEELMLNMEELQKELNKAIKNLASATDLDERIKLSELIKNLTDSIGVFFSFASEMMYHDMDMDEYPEDD